jgi:hypothetical protein
MSTWPSGLPNPAASGYAITPIDQVARTEMDVGAARTRRRTAARNDKIDLSWRLRDTQMATFRTWFDNPAECAGGAAWFTVNLAIGTGGVVSVQAKFVGAPKYAILGGLNWSVTAKVEVR